MQLSHHYSLSLGLILSTICLAALGVESLLQNRHKVCGFEIMP